MVTNVTTVLVGKKSGVVTSADDITVANAGKFVLMDVDCAEEDKMYETSADTKRFKVGLITNKTVAFMDPGTKAIQQKAIVKWSNIISKPSVRHYETCEYKADTPETVAIKFTANTTGDVQRILLRVTYKDMTTRYRKWTETYEYIAAANETATNIAIGFEKVLSANYKRNRFTVSRSGDTITLTAMPYDDDNAVDTINVANTVRFDVHMYYTMPNADGWATKNKYAYPATITKTPAEQYQASAKLVRDREAWAMGYEGILNRGEGTWPIIKPEMNTELDAHYDGLTLEFWRRYRAADDIVRETRETLEIYATATNIADVKAKIEEIIADQASVDAQQSTKIAAIESEIGKPTDTADANGSIYARIAAAAD